MKKLVMCLFLCVAVLAVRAQGVDPASLVIAKVIKAIDLQVQKLQNQTIWLQQAQQVAEHELSKLKLAEIADWQRKQQQLYADYFKELQTVRNTVKALPQVKQILSLQSEVMSMYSRLVKDGTSRSSPEALLGLSRDIVSSLQEVINGNGLVIKDAERVKRIAVLRDGMQDCLDDMKQLDKAQFRIAATKKQQQSDIKKSLQLFKN